MSLKLIKRSLILFELAEMQIFNISKGLKPLPHQNTRISVFEAIIKRKIGFEYKEYTCATCRPWGQILLYCIYRHSLTSKECIVFCWKKTIIFIWKYAEWKMLTYSYEEDKVENFMFLFSWKPTIQSQGKQFFSTIFRSIFIASYPFDVLL